jgi:hypothetical protein
LAKVVADAFEATMMTQVIPFEERL